MVMFHYEPLKQLQCSPSLPDSFSIPSLGVLMMVGKSAVNHVSPKPVQPPKEPFKFPKGPLESPKEPQEPL